MKICNKCGKQFNESGKHLSCSKCRGRKHNCPICGKPIRVTYRTCHECVPRSGINNSNWKDGRTTLRGYIQLRVSNHPRGNYVFEHILVMEDELNRYIRENEYVHHKNGVKTDNRLENLELWTSNHPSGSRVSDLIDWAVELLNQYRPELLK